MPSSRMPKSDEVVERSVAAAGFSPRFGDWHVDWHVARHDVYGEIFCTKWRNRVIEAAEDVSDDGDAFSDDCLDEFSIWESESV
ncbi:hypothetical protein JG687_00008348 [Phytophthora cactorum]|uniref:Uncharacterized protein n=1 Tax=Phytophthora cactorum TaxID=29920 RepID=A0A329T0L0_9STRA|nr:hypothetical protein PC117_g4514 [Phytophthora cactorum]KAG3030408.1 hypothetical protein PC120_g3745 [Phytophthora cactorum]KAG3036525.1 hypothetical protein PC119_g4245 [Phytophthora cactorum]KAG3086420.1 hypothetical protein PC121_g4918 [Phytophthora cactorum]KAG3205383.1 hypothetical protein PC128_g1379 [Phytophthora cactorum]